MNTERFHKLAGLFFLLGAVLVNVPYSLLLTTFEYPDILREPPGYILTQYAAGGTQLLMTWFTFAWVGLPLLFGAILLHRLLADEAPTWMGVATTFGVLGLVVQVAGLLRWVFVVPVLARTYTDPATSEATRAAVEVVFQGVHQYGGVILGEHMGQLFTIAWMVIVSAIMLRSRLFRPWLGWFGFVASAIYGLAQLELLATVIPGLPYWGLAGLLGSLL
jgi:hypothetical protein